MQDTIQAALKSIAQAIGERDGAACEGWPDVQEAARKIRAGEMENQDFSASSAAEKLFAFARSFESECDIDCDQIRKEYYEAAHTAENEAILAAAAE